MSYFSCLSDLVSDFVNKVINIIAIALQEKPGLYLIMMLSTFWVLILSQKLDLRDMVAVFVFIYMLQFPILPIYKGRRDSE
jgi:hypothetical protein